MVGMALPLCLLLTVTLQGGLTQAPGLLARPGPLLLRLRRLEEQFLRLQEVTLSHLQSIASNYNISYNIDGRFQALAEQAEAAVAARAALGAELARLATAGRRLHRRLKRLEETVRALSPSLPEAGTKPHGLPGIVQSPGVHLERELPLQAVPSTPSPRRPKTRRWQQRRQEEGRWLPADARPGRAPTEQAETPRDAAPGPRATAPVLPTVTAVPQQPGEGRYGPLSPVPTCTPCRTGAVLLFPNTSAERGAVLGLGSQRGLRALSLCSWLATSAPSLGALLSYLSQDGRSQLAVRGHGEHFSGSTRFIMGDGQFRELPVTRLLDGKWHHLCLTWSSGQGHYRFYVDRRLLAAGSGFHRGYEIPAGGSLALGWEQDRPSRDFGPAKAFVGHLAGFALWRRALLPGEVARMATGRGMPRGPLLTLAGASLRGGVRRVACPCL